MDSWNDGIMERKNTDQPYFISVGKKKPGRSKLPVGKRNNR